MSWRDFFYFSKGERNALILLLCLITSSGIILILTNPPSFKPIETPPATSQQTRPEASVTSSDPSSFAISSTPTTDSSGRTAMRNESNPPSTSSRQPTTRRESTSERFNRMTSNQTSYPRTEKYSTGTVVELNSADTTILKKVPGIGSAFANRIVRFRNLLGGFYTVQQLAEVYGIDEERYTDLAPWFTVDASLIQKLEVNSLPQDSLRHPYINYRQARAIVQLRTQKKQLTGWENLTLLDEFSDQDKSRILPYLSFE